MSQLSPVSQKYLAWDTSSVTGVVVAFEVNDQRMRIVAEWSLSLETSKHSERLLWTLDTVLQSAGWTLQDLSGIGVGVGPGSFTGLRIGITTAKILAAQVSLRVVPLSSLALLARGVVARFSECAAIEPGLKSTLSDALVLACTDATKGEWFSLLGSAGNIPACFLSSSDQFSGVWNEEVSEKALSSVELMARAGQYLEKNQDARWIAVGQSVERYPEVFSALPDRRRILSASLNLNRIQPSILAQTTWEAVQQGLYCDFSVLKPRYLRASEAEVKLNQGLLKNLPPRFPPG